jgi:uncharacterized membrane protein
MLDIHLIHPKMVHFTVALLIMAWVFELLRRLTRKETFGEAARWNMIFGGLAAVAALVTGLLAEDRVVIPAAAGEVFERHETFGYITMILGAVLLVLQVAPGGLYRRFRTLVLIVSTAAVVSLSIGAYNGGRLVYDFGVGVTKAPGAVEKRSASDNPAGIGSVTPQGDQRTGTPGI